MILQNPRFSNTSFRFNNNWPMSHCSYRNIFLVVISTFFIIVLLKTNNLSNENLNKDNTPSNFNNNDGV